MFEPAENIFNNYIYRFLQYSTSVYFFLIDVHQKKIEFFNKNIPEVLRSGRFTLQNYSIEDSSEIIHPGDKIMILNRYYDFIKFNFQHHILFKKLFSKLEFRIKNKEGNWIWFETECMLIINKNSRKIFGYIKEITHEHEWENFLNKNFNNSLDPQWNSKVKSVFHQSINGQRKELKYNNNSSLQDYFDRYHITKREKEILGYIANGHTAREIANVLNISEHTVINHRKNLISKFHVKNTAELIKESSMYFNFF